MMRSFIIALLLLAAVAVNANAQHAGRTVYISGTLGDTSHTDTLSLLVWDEFFSSAKRNFMPHRTLKTVLKAGHFSFQAPGINKPVYFTLVNKDLKMKLEYELLDLYVASPGDSVQVHIAKINPVVARIPEDDVYMIRSLGIEGVAFSGLGAAGYKCQYALRESEKAFGQLLESAAQERKPRTNVNDTTGHDANIKVSLDRRVTYLAGRIQVLNTYRNQINKDLYQLLLADLYGEDYEARCFMLQFAYMELKRATGITDSATRQHYAALYQQQATTYQVTGVATEVLAFSRGYLQFITTKARLDHRMQQLYTDPFIYILKAYTGLLRDRAAAAYCIDNIRIMKQPDNLIQQALAVVKEPGSRSVLEGIHHDSGKGAAAYNFSLSDSSGRVVRLSDFKGKVVFIDFWYTGCGACSKFYKNSLSVVEKTFEHHSDVVFLTVSIDPSREVWQRSVHNGLYTSGNESNVINLYTNGESIGHPLIVHYKIAGYPFQLLIDKKGRIYKSSELQRPSGELIPIIKEALAIQ